MLAYTDGMGIWEQVLRRQTSTSIVLIADAEPQLRLAAPGGVSLDGLAYAPGTVQGGGRYVWRSTDAIAPQIVTALRNAALP